MTQTELIGKIKAEIEGRIKSFEYNGGIYGSYEAGELAAYKELLSFIESLEQSIDGNKMIGLDEAAEEYVNGVSYFGNDIELEKEQSKRDFKAGAEWMARQGGPLMENLVFAELKRDLSLMNYWTVDSRWVTR